MRTGKEHPTPEENGCPLCHSKETTRFHEDRKRSYLICPNCQLVFVPTRFHLSLSDEKDRYDLHQNDPNDPGYRDHIYKLLTPLLERISPPATGIDFGSGPVPSLSHFMSRHAIDMNTFDIFYSNDRQVLNHRYDCLTCAEVIEHFRKPDIEFKTLFGLLKPGGWMGLMTGIRREEVEFSSWHYISDPTHIGYYAAGTFEWLSSQHNASIDYMDETVVILRYHGGPSLI